MQRNIIESSSSPNQNAQVNQRIIDEAIDEKYTFCIYDQKNSYQIPANEIEAGQSGIKFELNSQERLVLYDKLSVQIFPKQKIINVIERSPYPWQLIILASIPYILGFFLVYISREYIPNPKPINPPFQYFFDSIFNALGITRGEVRGFGWAIFIVSAIAMFLVNRYVAQSSYKREVRASYTLPQIIEKLEQASDEQQYFSRLIQVNLRNMEQYYLLVRTQTEKSYRLTQFAAFVGFVTLIAGILLSFIKGFNSPSTIVTITSGVLIEFISAVFFYIYNRTVAQLNIYHEKLVNVQDTMLALKVAQIVQNPNLKDETMAYLTRALTNRLRLIEMKEASMEAISEPNSLSESSVSEKHIKSVKE